LALEASENQPLSVILQEILAQGQRAFAAVEEVV
jgi:hypothetical protein